MLIILDLLDHEIGNGVCAAIRANLQRDVLHGIVKEVGLIMGSERYSSSVIVSDSCCDAEEDWLHEVSYDSAVPALGEMANG